MFTGEIVNQNSIRRRVSKKRRKRIKSYEYSDVSVLLIKKSFIYFFNKLYLK